MEEKIIDNLILESEKWDQEDHKYICLGIKDQVYFTNNLDCDGGRYWSRFSFEQFVKKNR